MRIVVYAEKQEAGERIKEMLEEFGHGMHITVSASGNPEVLSRNWSHIIIAGNCKEEVPAGTPVTHCPALDDEAELKRTLWALYRDTLRDLTGGECSCGLHDTCHCH